MTELLSTDVTYIKSYLDGISKLPSNLFHEYFPHANLHYGSRTMLNYALTTDPLYIKSAPVYRDSQGGVYYSHEINGSEGYKKALRLKVTVPIKRKRSLEISIPEAIYNSVIYDWSRETDKPYYLTSLARTHGIPHALTVLATSGRSLLGACSFLEECLNLHREGGAEVFLGIDRMNSALGKLLNCINSNVHLSEMSDFYNLWNKVADSFQYDNKLQTDKHVVRDFLRLQYKLSDIMAHSSGYSCAYEVNAARLSPIQIVNGNIQIIFISEEEKDDMTYGVNMDIGKYYLLTCFAKAQSIRPTDSENRYFGTIGYYDSSEVEDD